MPLDPTFYDAFRKQAQLLVPARPVLLALVRLYSWLAANRLERFREGALREFLRRGEVEQEVLARLRAFDYEQQNLPA